MKYFIPASVPSLLSLMNATDVGGERCQFQSDKEQEEVLRERNDGHAQTRGQQEDVEVDLPAIVVQTRG